MLIVLEIQIPVYQMFVFVDQVQIISNAPKQKLVSLVNAEVFDFYIQKILAYQLNLILISR